jgi:tetratricopeptide (TPR) repeat protein
MIGTRLGPYSVSTELGAGAMGTVWLAEVAEDEAIVPRGTRVAVKVVHPHLLGQPGFFKRFMREAEIGRQVDHENVVRTFDVDALEIEGTTAHFLVMEYVEGRTLRAMLQDLGTVPEALLREIARQVAAGLSAIHDAGVVHRDLKPENILVTHDDQVRIMDLGVAKLVEASVALTRSGNFAGSLLYAAPEQFGDEPIGPAADLYSLGVLLYELATGENPFRRDGVGRVIAAHLHETPRSAIETGADVSPFFNEVLTALLAKDPAARFECAAALRGVMEQGERSAWWAERERDLMRSRGPLPVVPVRRETELYGRESELGILCGALQRARQGEGNTVLFEGEAGIGKTRLVDAFLKELNGDDVHVLYGSYSPSGGQSGISDSITDHFGLARLEEALGPYLTVTPSLVPAFAALVKHESPPAGSDPIQGDSLHAVMVHLMRGLAAEKPLVWVIDDLHFADVDSRKIALSLARAVQGHRVLLLVTSRPGLPEDELAHLSRLGHYRRAGLGRLSPRQVIQLLRDAFKSEALADRLGAKVAYKSDGVPFFVFEMIRGLKDGQFLQERADGTWIETQVIEEIEVPSAVKDLIEARLRDLSDDERNILDVAAVNGFEFDPDVLARVLERRPIAMLQRLAGIERRSGVVRTAGDDYRFDHHQIQEVLYEGMAGRLRKEYHAAIGEALETRHPEPDGATAADICGHLLRGGRGTDARPHLDAALTHLEKAYRNEAMLDLARRALDVDGLLPDEERVEVLLRVAARHGLRGARSDERAALDEAVALADAGNGVRLRAKALASLGWHLVQVSDFADARQRLEQATSLAGDVGDAKIEGRATGNLGNVHWCLGEYEDARSCHERHLAISKDIGDRKGETFAMGNLGNVAWSQGSYEEARERFVAVLALTRETGDLRSEAVATCGLGNVYLDLGEFEKARACYEDSLARSREIGNPQWEAVATGNLGNVLLGQGQAKEARARYERSLALAREIGDLRGETTATGNLASLFLTLGRSEEALATCGRFVALAREIRDRRGEAIATGNLGNAYLGLGDDGEARRHLERWHAIACEIGNRRLEGHALFALSSLDERDGNPDEALRLLGESLDLRRELGEMGTIADTLVAMARIDAARGHVDRARTSLDEALAIATEVGSPGTILAATVDLARLPDGDMCAALAAFEEHGDKSGHGTVMDIRFRLWELTDDETHLDDAHRLLCFMRDHAPEEYRETMITNVILHRDIMAAWQEHGR